MMSSVHLRVTAPLSQLFLKNAILHINRLLKLYHEKCHYLVLFSCGVEEVVRGISVGVWRRWLGAFQ